MFARTIHRHGVWIVLALISACNNDSSSSVPTPIQGAAASSLSFSASTYMAATTTAQLTVDRGTTSSGAASVNYATSDGTAVAGTDYTAASGTLSWADGDAAAKVITITLSNTGHGSNSFTVALSGATGATLGSPATATVSIAAKSIVVGSTTLAIKVQGTQFVDGNGAVVQLRGVNASGLESVAIQGWSAADPWGGMKPVWSAMQAWKVNAVRLPLNEASWLDYSCVDANGAKVDPDPGKNYRATVEQTVTEAVAAGFYVILDLHWSAPGNLCPTDQNWMADADHSVAFWTSVAGTFKNNAAVIFELYNEPVLTDTDAGWTTWLNGGAQTTTRAPSQMNYAWTSAGMQQLLDAVRATGATNVVLCGGIDYSNILTGFPTHTPVDALKQLGAAWHVYSDNPYVNPAAGNTTGNMLAAVKAKVPLAITELGDTVGAGSTGSFAATVLTYGDSAGDSYFGWTWNDWNQSANVLITDANGTPTVGFGTYFKQHVVCRSTSTSCQ